MQQVSEDNGNPKQMAIDFLNSEKNSVNITCLSSTNKRKKLNVRGMTIEEKRQNNRDQYRKRKEKHNSMQVLTDSYDQADCENIKQKEKNLMPENQSSSDVGDDKKILLKIKSKFLWILK